MCMGSYNHILSCQAISDAASRGPDEGSAYPVMEAPRWDDWMPGSFLDWGRRGNGQTGGEILSAHV
jgi:hypothetical protein